MSIDTQMRFITRATLLTIVYTVITSRWFIAYRAILGEFMVYGVDYEWALDQLWRVYVNQPALILSIVLLIATIVTGILEDKRNTDFLELS